PPALYTLSLHDALPIWLTSLDGRKAAFQRGIQLRGIGNRALRLHAVRRGHGAIVDVRFAQRRADVAAIAAAPAHAAHVFDEHQLDRKSTRLNSSHRTIS